MQILFRRIASRLKYRQFSSQPAHQPINPNPKIDKPIIYTITGLNTAVFAGWTVAQYQSEYKQDTRLFNFMCHHFSLSQRELSVTGNYHTLITYSFSHMSFPHFVHNMMALWMFAPTLVNWMGRSGFMIFYLGSGVFTASSSMIYYMSDIKEFDDIVFNGASGSIISLFGAFVVAFPNVKLLSLPVKYYVGVMAMDDALGMMKPRNYETEVEQIGVATHAAGWVYGIGLGLLDLAVRKFIK